MYLEQYLKCIKSFYPSLEIRTIHWNHFGQNNDILFLNNKWVFRFPKHDKALKSLQTECEQLSFIRPYITLPIPDPVFVNTDTNILGQAFFGYPLIPGAPLHADSVKESPSSIRNQLANGLATFLKEIHSIPTENAPGVVVSNEGAQKYWANLYREINQSLFSYIQPGKQKDITRHFEGFLDEPSNFNFSPVMIHGDFGVTNILFDEKNAELTGIIDFGSCHIGDPAIDLAGLYKHYGRDFVQLMLTYFPQLEEVFPRAEFYAGTFALQEALYGFKHQDHEAFENGLKEYV